MTTTSEQREGALSPQARERIGRRLQDYYQMVCTNPTPARLQMLLDELTRRADAKSEP